MLKDCPCCGRLASLVIGKELSDGSKDYIIKCSYLDCIAIKRNFSGYSPNYNTQLNNFYEEWNLICDTLEHRKEIK